MNISVDIERLSSGGEGVGRLPDGKVVFVPRTAPGDVVEVEVLESQKRFSRGVVARLVSDGPDRIEPKCPHYEADECGSCQFQHLHYTAQLRAKATMVGDALRRLGGLDSTDPGIEPADSSWGYRSKVTLTAKASDSAGRIGYRSYLDPEKIFDLKDCLLATDKIRDAWKAIVASDQALPEDLTKLVLREVDSRIHLVLWTKQYGYDASTLSETLGPGGTVWVVGKDKKVIQVGGEPSPPVPAFEQSSPGLAQKIREEACAALGDIDGKDLLDLYCGTGATASILAGSGARVLGVDSDAGAIEWAQQDVPGVVFKAAEVEEILGDLGDPNSIILNPPRSGLSKRVREWLSDWARQPGRSLAYISCDPATLARDVKHLNMHVVCLRAYDLFPQTSHVETLMVLRSE